MQIRSDGRSPGVAAVVLAAGCSRRMGRHKLLLPWRGRAILVDVVERVRAAASHVVVVTGHDAHATKAALSDPDVQFIHNPDYADGEMISSVKTGVAALPRACEAFFLVLGDQPGIAPETFAKLIHAWRASENPRIVSPTWNNRRGHPVLFSAAGTDEILKLPADATLKTYVERHAGDSIEVDADDPAVCADVDTPQQYLRLLAGESPGAAGAAAAALNIGSQSCPTEAIAAD